MFSTVNNFVSLHLRLTWKWLFTKITGKGFLSSVNFHMSCHIKVTIECFLTDGAWMWALTSVNYFVTVQMAFKGKWLLTNITGKRFFAGTGVQFHVFVKIRYYSECFLTNRTWMCTFSSMNQFVSPHSSFVWKCPQTNITGKGFLTRMYSSMCCQMMLKIKGFLADQTWKTTFPSVDNFVVVQGTFLWKCLLTNITRIWFFTRMCSLMDM